MITTTNSMEFFGKSSDEKPTQYLGKDIANGSIFFEIDTQILYIYDEEDKEWVEVI